MSTCLIWSSKTSEWYRITKVSARDDQVWTHGEPQSRPMSRFPPRVKLIGIPHENLRFRGISCYLITPVCITVSKILNSKCFAGSGRALLNVMFI